MVATMFQPFFANSRAAAFPKPDDVPVIKTVFFIPVSFSCRALSFRSQ
jgi:hypothetical protein